MSQHCGTSFDHVALMMSPATGSEAQSVAAFMLLRGPHALWGKGWMGDNKVFCEYLCQPNSETETAAQTTLSFCADDPVLGQMDPGEPTGRCELVDPAAGVFKRRYSKMTVTLHCDTWMAEFAPSRN